jgi:hypothetical protein
MVHRAVKPGIRMHTCSTCIHVYCIDPCVVTGSAAGRDRGVERGLEERQCVWLDRRKKVRKIQCTCMKGLSEQTITIAEI